MNFIKELQSFIERESLLERSGRIVVAVSGGPDSMALLHGLKELNDEADLGWALHVAHLNHQLRADDAEMDASFVRDAAERLALPCTVESVDVRTAQKVSKGSLEEIARRERYAFLERVCLRTDCHVVALGHQADDNAETIFHRIARGTGLRGLSGIAPDRPLGFESGIRLIRPLLTLRKSQLLEYLAERGIQYRTDPSNQSAEYTRNRIRNRILPLLADQINPQVIDALLRLGEQARWLQAYLHETAQRQLESLIVHQTDQELVLNARALAQKRHFIATELVRQAILRFQLGEQDLSFGHLVNVVELAAAPATGKQLHLPGGLTVTRQYDRLHFSLPSDEPREEIAPEVLIHVPGCTRLPVRRTEIQTSFVDSRFEDLRDWKRRKPTDCEWVDFDRLRPPLVVRARRPGDRFWPLGATGSKKLSDFFIDRKVSAQRRQRVAILCDQLGPIWIVSFQIDDRVKITRATRRVLQLESKQW